MPIGGRAAGAAALAALLCACAAPKGTPPPPPPDTREIEERTDTSDADTRGPLGIPEAELPPVGQCRIWYPGRAAAEQPPPQGCGEAEGAAPPAVRVLYRPPEDERVVHVRVMHPTKPGEVLRIDLYDAETESYLGTQQP